MVNTQINAAQSVQLRNIHVPTKGASMLCEVGRDCYEGCLEGDICNESTWLCEIPQSYVVDTDCKLLKLFLAVRRRGCVTIVIIVQKIMLAAMMTLTCVLSNKVNVMTQVSPNIQKVLLAMR